MIHIMIQVKDPPTRSERRTTFRNSGCRKGTLIFDGFRRLDTLVKNWNERGARVDFEFAGAVPRFATLVAPALGIHSDIQVVWQAGDRAGVRFVGESVRR